MKSSNLSQNIIATLDILYFPFPCVTWCVQTKFCTQNSTWGGFWTLPLNSLIRSACLAWNATWSILWKFWSRFHTEGSPPSAIAQRWLLARSSVWAFTRWGVEIRMELVDCHQTLKLCGPDPYTRSFVVAAPYVWMSTPLLRLLEVTNELGVSMPQNAKHATWKNSSSIRKTVTVVFSKKSYYWSA